METSRTLNKKGGEEFRFVKLEKKKLTGQIWSKNEKEGGPQWQKKYIYIEGVQRFDSTLGSHTVLYK